MLKAAGIIDTRNRIFPCWQRMRRLTDALGHAVFRAKRNGAMAALRLLRAEGRCRPCDARRFFINAHQFYNADDFCAAAAAHADRVMQAATPRLRQNGTVGQLPRPAMVDAYESADATAASGGHDSDRLVRLREALADHVMAAALVGVEETRLI
ncbi:hypothetical protein LN533_00440 [Xanthomonas vesicatoria]|uniref:Uncharacterized protein n=1 Tax=Xanthomonas vesicatoria TaxID=56460 RepID=A0ABS8L8N0_9XANT|nr:hypothetical protein [Xanthomonas vesicatoria]MCC8622116.1 hypothetical protein [Xanthomonas vesicatoria]MCC8693966.1 hypothetical protein [Xanthomonas vesicatoria]MCC8700742.1 hypothetical protein [Xanthomonas vesicatoria]MDG4489509.1 hypothetical protein [Xanthomonas vesicatoria]